MDGIGDPLIGTVIGGKYTVRKLIGRGGVGLVYLATHVTAERTRRDVVVKVLDPRWSQDSETLARFEREATRLSTLRHPNIVRMFDHGRDGNRAYLVMEYCKGELLSDYVERNRQLTLEQFVPIAAQLLKGIGHCHSRDMMVRDIKPANVMLVERKGRANFVKVLDFGLAKLVKDDQSVTQEHVMGTVGYLSPEQIRGEELDLRVDVYAVGVLFYFMISGRLPFDGETNATVFYKTVNEPPPDLREILPDGSGGPDGLIALIQSCLEKDREMRPGDADAIVERLIDVVPAPLFRLPRADTARHGIASNVVPPGHGNTGMMELLGTDKSPSTPIPTLDPAVEPVDDAQDDEPAPSPAQPEPGAVAAPVAAASSTLIAPPRSNWMLPVVATLAGVGIAAVLWTSLGGSDDEVTPAAPASVAGDKSAIGPELDAAARHLKAGALDEAEAKLDAVADRASTSTSARARFNKLQRQLQLQRLMQTGAQFEGRDQIRAAAGAYRDALAVDPTFVPAREAIARLETPAPDATTGAAAISSAPEGSVFIDGKPRGKTPFREALTVGVHQVEIRADGYETWTGEIEVKPEGTDPLAVGLTKQPRSRGHTNKPRTKSKPRPAPVDPPEPVAKPTPKPDPAPKPSDPGPFLPTKGKDKDSVFLPTKD